MTFLRNLWNEEQGQDLIEYTLLMAFVALASAALFLGAGSIVGDREAPARVLRVVADQDFAFLFSLEAMLQGVDHELRHYQP